MREHIGLEGFTLVELSLSIAFISILSITAALIVSNTVASYHRGVILNLVNTAGMEIVDDIRSSIQNAQARAIIEECENSEIHNNTLDFECGVWWSQKANVKVNGKNLEGGAPINGALCTGSYSYIWNSGYFWNENSKNSIEGSKLSFRWAGGSENDFKIIKVQDIGRKACTTSGNAIDFTGESLDESPVDLLSRDDSLAGLVLYNLSAAATESGTLNNTFYAVSFILGTVQGGIDIRASNDYCKTDLDYCAINKFNFAAQANGG